jgi:vancomycin permeability regulator SanA
LGVENSKKIGYIILLAFVVLYFFIETVTWLQFLPKLIIALVLGIFIYKSKKNQNRYFSSFWVEAIPIFWLALEVIVYWLL